MTQEEKQILLKDLCARLRYGVKCYPVITNGEPNTIGGYCELLDDFFIREVVGWFNISMIKPYLRPMSSMTEEENADYHFYCETVWDSAEERYYHYDTFKSIDWLNANHFDYRGLIPMGLALPATEDMYNTKTE